MGSGRRARALLMSLLLLLSLAAAGCSGSDEIVGEELQGNSGASEPADGSSIDTTLPPLPEAPVNLTGTAGDGRVQLAWDAAAGAESYVVHWNSVGGVSPNDAAAPVAETSWAHEGLSNGENYCYAVAGVNAAGEGALSSEVCATPAAPLPGAPSGVSATAGYESVTVGWDAVPGAISYNLYWSETSPVSLDPAARIAGVSAPYMHAGLDGGTAYYYVVTAVSAEGEGFSSAQVSAVADYPLRRAFVTSASGTGNLAGWADAGGKTGIAAADAICQARADAAGIGGSFRAWISDESTDAYCHAHGIMGKKKSANCGEASLPLAAGPWVRMDGEPFADRIDQALAPTYRVYHPALFDELGNELAWAQYYTNTTDEGKNASASVLKPCDNWGSAGAAAGFVGGSASATGRQWSDAFGALCSGSRHLLCLEAGQGGRLPSRTISGMRVFVTSTSGNGNLATWADAAGKNGAEAGDAICAAAAERGGLTGTFGALLSDSVITAESRVLSNGPWYRLDGVRVADDLADLLDGNIDAPINLTEEEGYLAGGAVVFTGSASDGMMEGDHCLDWKSSAGAFFGHAADAVRSTALWLDDADVSCSTSGRLYCFEH